MKTHFSENDFKTLKKDLETSPEVYLNWYLLLLLLSCFSSVRLCVTP